MPIAPSRKCTGAPDCKETVEYPEVYCAKHKVRPPTHPCEDIRRSANGKRYREQKRRQHPICQRIINGLRCQQPSTVLHHLRQPEVVEDFYDDENVVMVCAEHHPGGQAGTPNWIKGRDYDD